jgi:uncharacterized membrane protein YfcA
MLDYLIYTIFGLISGISLGTIGFNPVILVLLILNVFNIGDYKSNLGSLMVLNMFPISIGSVFEFYKSGQINWSLAWILTFNVILGSYLGSKLITNKKYSLTNKTIQYLTGIISIIFGIAFLISAYYEKN